VKSVLDAFRISVLSVAIIFTADFQVQAKRKVVVPGQRAIVIDERLSALRVRPDLKSTLEQRLRRGRIVGIVGSAKRRDGTGFLRVALSRNTRGWILADAVVRTGILADAEKLLTLIEGTADDFIKAKLARLFMDEFGRTKFAPRALLILGETAERAAERLARDAKRRIGDIENSEVKRRSYFLNYAGLDRFNRIGVTFDYDEMTDSIIYDGAAFRELLRRYPKSAEAKIVTERSRNKRK
jgi:hypothetical protein